MKLSRDGWGGLAVLAASLFLFALTLGLKDNPLVPIGPGYYPRIVKASAELLAPSTNTYIFVSSVSAYASHDAVNDESQPSGTMEDPTVFTAPFTGELPFTKIDEMVYEYACHEGNYAMTNILQGERKREAGTQKQ